MVFPDNKRFAFSILDDTDDATLKNVKPVYDVLREYGFRTTKTVWPLDCPEGSRIFFAAETLQNKPYLDFVHELAGDGFEVAFHGATMEPSHRERTIRALEFLKKEFGYYPRLFCTTATTEKTCTGAISAFKLPFCATCLAWRGKNLLSILPATWKDRITFGVIFVKNASLT